MMPTSLEAVFVLLILLPGCFGYFFFSRMYNRKIEDNVGKVVYIALFNVGAILILGAIRKDSPWSINAAESVRLVEIEGYIYGALFWLSLISAFLGILAALVGNSDAIQSWLVKKGLTRRSQHPSVLAAVIAEHPETFLKVRFKGGGYVVGCPRKYSLDGEEDVLFLTKAARRPARPAAERAQPPEYEIEGPGILLLSFDEIQCVEVLRGADDV